MALAQILQDFGTSVPGAEKVLLLSESEQEAQTIASYERGYAAGWEDALTLQIEEKSKLSDVLRENLQDLDFTLAEARAQVLQSVVPFLEALTAKILPEIAQDAATATLKATVENILAEQAEEPIILKVADGDEDKLRPIVGHAVNGKLSIEGDPALTAGRIVLHVAETEQLFDPAAVLADLHQAVAGLGEIMKKETGHAREF